MKYRAMIRQRRKGKMLPDARVERHQKVARRHMGKRNIMTAISSASLMSSATRR